LFPSPAQLARRGGRKLSELPSVFAGFAVIRAICGIPGLTIQRFNDFNAAKPTFRVSDHKNLRSTSVKG
jgi:hypothetical protein